MNKDIPKALTIAGSDSGGGAGIQADLKTFAMLGVHGSCVITALTAQNTREVTAVHNIPLEMITAQLDAVMVDIGADAVKIGMLSNAAIITTVVAGLQKHHLKNIIVDPVMIAASGAKLLEDQAIATLKRELIPHAALITPNIPEAEILVGHPLKTPKAIEEAGKELLCLGCAAVLIKGGHATTNTTTNDVKDYFFDGTDLHVFTNKRFAKEGHGTGCTLSSAITAYLARGMTMKDAVQHAIAYVHGAIKHGYKVGACNYVLDHGWQQKKAS
ncbi:bifunctional hydroxymethylpyrimidine kinase/phosphomethylpyrimidine kinase [Candidatus Woesearchaeota archaeon]|nr:bifunctional hydroxymethylpyrimidine kinase/phosphomethylpyrimidine kinase [Candidatus Woesearchaeota archaeon]